MRCVVEDSQLSHQVVLQLSQKLPEYLLHSQHVAGIPVDSTKRRSAKASGFIFWSAASVFKKAVSESILRLCRASCIAAFT